MPFTGSSPTKVYVRSDGVRSGVAVHTQAKNAAVNDTSELADAHANDMADAINLMITRDGSTQPSANLPMNTYRHTGVGNAAARDDYAAAGQVQNSSLIYGGTAGGTANALTLDLSPNITAYAAGQMFVFEAAADNTSGTVTVNIDGVGAASLKKLDGSANPAIGDIQAGGVYVILYDGAAFQLLNPSTPNDHYIAAGGTGDAITLTLVPALPAYVEGAVYNFKATATNTGAATININGLGAVNLRKGAAGSTALGAGDITSGGVYSVMHDGTNAQLLNPGLGRNVSAYMATVLDDADAATARSTLGLGSIATQAASSVNITGGSISGITDLAVADGGTGASTAAGARTNLGAVLTDAVFPGALIAIIVDRKTAGTSPQSLSTGTDNIRTLNTLDYNRNSAVSLSGGTTGTDGTATQFVLPAGSWEIRWSAPAYQTGGFQTILRDVTAGADIARGTSEAAVNNTTPTRSFGVWRVTPAGSNTYEIRQRVGIANLGGINGLGFGPEVYTRVEIYAA